MTFTQYVTYAQIAVFNAGLARPFNDWTDRHVRQGFSWREQSVSFRTLVEDGDVTVIFAVADIFRPAPGSVRTIGVPFRCRSAGSVEIATITDTQTVPLIPGGYRLVFETGVGGGTQRCRFTAIPGGGTAPSIEIADAGLAPSYPLLMTASAA